MAPKQKEEGKEGLSITIWAGGALRDVEETGRGAAAAAALAVPLLPGRRSPAHLALEIGHFWWRWLSVVPPFGVLPGTEGLGDRWESPSRCPFNWAQYGRH